MRYSILSIVLFLSIHISAQTRVSGTVYDQNNQPIAFANVLFKNSSEGVISDFDGNFIKGKASFKLNEDISASAQINHSSKVPNYNFLLYQSDYINYNWRNNFKNTETQQLAFLLKCFFYWQKLFYQGKYFLTCE